MKKYILLSTALIIVTSAFAQDDSTAVQNYDTLKVGNYIILNKKSNDTDTKNVKEKKKKSINVDISFGKNSNKKKNPNLSTNWWVFDIGFTNLRDQTNYTSAQAGNYLQTIKNGPVTENSMSLINRKSSNFNIWFFMQKLNISNHQLNLKYGLGLEMYNFRYERNLSYRKDPFNYVFNDSINFSKNKLYAGYITVPVMLNFNPTPSKNKGFSASAGMSFGYLISSRNKQISSERGKQKISGNFDLEPFRVATIAELGLGPVRLYGSYSLNSLHKASTGLQQYPYVIGVRLSNW